MVCSPQGPPEKARRTTAFQVRPWRSFNQRTTGGAVRSPNVETAELMQCPDVTAKLSGKASPDHPSHAAPKEDELLHCALTKMNW